MKQGKEVNDATRSFQDQEDAAESSPTRKRLGDYETHCFLGGIVVMREVYDVCIRYKLYIAQDDSEE